MLSRTKILLSTVAVLCVISVTEQAFGENGMFSFQTKVNENYQLIMFEFYRLPEKTANMSATLYDSAGNAFQSLNLEKIKSVGNFVVSAFDCPADGQHIHQSNLLCFLIPLTVSPNLLKIDMNDETTFVTLPFGKVHASQETANETVDMHIDRHAVNDANVSKLDSGERFLAKETVMVFCAIVIALIVYSLIRIRSKHTQPQTVQKHAN